MAIAVVQSVLNEATGGDEIAEGTFASAATAGNSLLFFVRWLDSATATAITSITITSESSATLSISRVPLHATGLADVSHAWGYLSNITTANTKTCTLTMDGVPSTGHFSMWELSGCDTTGMLGATKSLEGDSIPISTTLTTTRANSAIFATYDNDSGEQSVQTSPAWTDIAMDNITWYSDGAYIADVGAAGSQTIDPASTDSPGDWGLTAVEILSPAAGGGATPHNPFGLAFSGPFGGPIG